MSERYSRLFTLPENLYAVDSPVVIAAGALLKDNQTGKVIAQLKLQNISTKAIKAATVSVIPFDTVGNPLGDPIQYQYLDLNALRDENFGSQSAIFLADITTRSFAATVKEIAFVDNTVWIASNDPWEPLPVPTTISSVHGAEFAKQFCLEYGAECKYFPTREKDLWRCACGTINHQHEGICHSCREAFASISRYNVDELEQNKNNRLVYEKQTAENEAKQAKRKKKRMVGIVAILICLVVAVWICIRPPQVKLTDFNTDRNAMPFTIASSIPRSDDYLHFEFLFRGPLNGETYTLQARIQWPGEKPMLTDFTWDNVKVWDMPMIEWPKGYSAQKSGILTIEILDVDTDQILGKFEIEVD